MTEPTSQQPPLQQPVAVNRSVSLLPSKTQQILQQPSIIRPPTNPSTLIKKIVAATKQKLKVIRKKYLNERKNKPIHYITHHTHHQIQTIIPGRDHLP